MFWEKITRRIPLGETPRRIALGFSIGLFIGMTPFLGIHLILSVILTSFFGGNKLAAAVGVNITNVVTAPLIYPINYWVGVKLSGISGNVPLSFSSENVKILSLVKQSPLILADLVIGGVALGVPLALVGYIGALKLVGYLRSKKRKSEVSELMQY